jgi:hypothetical protein
MAIVRFDLAAEAKKIARGQKSKVDPFTLLFLLSDAYVRVIRH